MPLAPPIRRSLSTACVAWLVAWAAPSRAEAASPARARLVWQRGDDSASCIGASELEAAVEARLGRRLFAAAGEPAAVVLRIALERQDDGRYHARVWLEPEPGHEPDVRELEVGGDDCRQLDEPLALVVSIMADAELARRDAAVREPPPDPEYEAELKKPVLTAPTLQAAPPRPWRASGELALLGGAGVLPDLAAGAELGVQLEPPRFASLQLHGVAFLPDTEAIAGGGSVSFWLGYAGVGLCPELGGSARLELRGCIGVDAGALRVRSRGLIAAGKTYRFVLASEIGVRGALTLGAGWSVGASLTAFLPLRPETFRYERADGQSEKVFQMAHLAALAGVGARLRFR